MSPSFTLFQPINELNTTNPSVTFLGSVRDDREIINLSLFIDGVLNQTNSSGIKNVNYTFTAIFAEDDYTWFYRAVDNDSNTGTSSTRSFEVHLTPPEVIITFPSGTIDSFVIGNNLFLNWTVTEEGQNTSEHISNCSYGYNNAITYLNLTTCLETNYTSFLYVNNVNTLNFTAGDRFHFNSTNTTSWGFAFLETNVTFEGNVSETSNQEFEINLTTDINVLSISAIFDYNGTNHTSVASCTEGNCTVSNIFDVPLVLSGESILYDFFWTLTIFNGTESSSITTSTRQQNVSKIHLEECDATYEVQSLNFTVYDEQNLTRVNLFKFDGSFEQWLGGGNVKRQSNFSDSSTEDMALCISPNSTYHLDAIIEYDESGNGSVYTLRNYFFQNDIISNTSQEIFLYLLKSSDSTSFILKVQDDSLLPVADVLIETNRYYPGTDEFRVVQIAKTNSLGKSVGFFETEIVDYKFLITEDNKLLLETGLQKVIPEVSPFTLTFTIGEPLGEPWSTQEEIGDLNSSLVWDSISGIVTYSYIDSSENFTLGRLLVIKESLVNISANEIICNETSTLISATLTCIVGSTDGFYIASTFITRENGESLDKQISFHVETLSGVVGLLGLFFGFFLILISAFMFKFNEIAGIWAMTVTVLLVNLTGLIKFGGVFVTAIIAIAIILTWIMER